MKVDLRLPVELTGKCACIVLLPGDHKHTDDEWTAQDRNPDGLADRGGAKWLAYL